MNKDFRIVETRFHAVEMNKYVVIAVASGMDTSTLDVQGYLDHRSLPTEVSIYKGPELAAKYMYEEVESLEEIHVIITLPEYYEQSKLFRMELSDEAGHKAVWACKTREITEASKRYHTLLECRFEGDECVLLGTCSLPQPIRVALLDEDGGEIKARIAWQPRAEVRCYYPEYGYLAYSDYKIRFCHKERPCISIRLQADNGMLIERISLQEKQKYQELVEQASVSLWGKLKYYSYRIVKALSNDSVTVWKERIANRINEHKAIALSETKQYNQWLKNREPSDGKIEEQSKATMDVYPVFGVQELELFRKQSYKNWKVGCENCDYVVIVPKDAIVVPNALYECAKYINENPDAEVIYGDSDVILTQEQYMQPNFKPDYNPDLLRSYNYIGEACVISKHLYDSGLLSDSESIYDFYLKCTEQPVVWGHIPRVLFHMPKDTGITEEVKHVQYQWEEEPLISILIPNKDHIEELDTCIRSLEKSEYRNYEIIIIENNSQYPETFEYYKRIEDARIHVIYYEGGFNYSRINNFGVEYAQGEYILLLNNDTELIAPNSLWELLSHAMRKEVGIVGAKLYFPDDTIQHAGVIIGYGGVAGHAFLGAKKDDAGYQNRIQCIQNYSAVTAACMMIPKKVYEQVGGLSEEYQVAFNDIDFCLRVREAGYLVVYNPYAEFYHYESKSRGCDDTTEKMVRYQQEIQLFTRRWNQILRQGDPYYNVNLSLEKKDFSIKE